LSRRLSMQDVADRQSIAVFRPRWRFGSYEIFSVKPMEEKLEELKSRLRDIEQEMSKPEVSRDQKRIRVLNTEHAHLAPIVQKYDEYRRVTREFADAGELFKSERDPAMKEMLSEELQQLELKEEKLKETLLVMLIPKDPNSGKDILMEIRAGTGGDEAALFGAELMRMYTRYCDIKGWRVEIIEINTTEIGGYKEVIFSVRNADAYDNLKFESGTHRVQRIPTTEAGGRIHTSAVTVAVLPEAEEDEIQINPDDLRIDVYRSSGHGGQSVNTTDSAVRITHIPTGIVVTCQNERSQLQNRESALRVLRGKLFDLELQRIEEEQARLKGKHVEAGWGNQIRSYVLQPYQMVKDLRTDVEIGNTGAVLDGEIDPFIQAWLKEQVGAMGT